MNTRIGQQLGSYRLLRQLGEGGFAEVYLAEHLHLKIQVAVKLLHGKLTAQYVQAFLNEARTIASLKHPHILRVLDFGFAQTLPFLVMDYAPGGTLRDRHPMNSVVPLPIVISYLKQITAALEYAHARKLIHRDVKPENMLIDADGSVLLSDFGVVATAHSTASMKTIDNSGTVHYMAPEQINGKPRPQSDQYSLAIVVYEWLCGKLPFEGESSIQIAMQQIFADPLPLLQQNASIPAGVEQVILKALAKNPQQRFDSVLAFVHALEQASQSVDQERFHRARNQAPLGVKTSPLAKDFFFPTPSASSTVPTQLNQKNLVERPCLWKSRNPEGSAFRSVGWSPDGSRIASVPYIGKLYVWNATTGDQLASRDYIQSPVIWSPPGNQIICRDTTGLVAINATTLEVIRTYTEDANPETVAACSPNGWYVAAAGWVSFNPPKVWHVATGKLISVYEGHGEEGVRCLAWSPDSKTIVSGGENRGVHIWDAATGRKLAFYRANNQCVYAVAWSPDGKQVALASSDDKVHLWEPPAAKRWSNHIVENATLFYAGHSVGVGTLAWSPNGRSIASGGHDGTIHVWDARTGGTIFIYKGHSGDINALAWSSDGTRIVSVSEDRTIQLWQAPQ